MTTYGYSLLCEQAPPDQLVGDAVRAEQVGFDFATVSDHYYPWLAEQGHSPYAWSVLGAMAHATRQLLDWPARAELPDPGAFAVATEHVRTEDVAGVVPCGPDLARHVAAVAAFRDAGFTDIGLVQVGGDRQDEFLDWSAEQLLPALRELD